MTRCATFYFWCRAMRPPAHGAAASALLSVVAAALSYAYMAAAWGGYVFVANIMALHACALLLLGRRPAHVQRCYSLFYALGTAAATRVPVVGLTPLTHTEHLGPLAAFAAINAAAFWRALRRRALRRRPPPAVAKGTAAKGAAAADEADGADNLGDLGGHAASLAAAAAAAALAIGVVAASGALGPVTVRVRALFLPHTHTGNPLVDSVAEHRPADANAYHQFLSAALIASPFGAAALQLRRGGPTDAGLFLLLLGAATYFFSSKMARLIVLLATPAAALAGVAAAAIVDFGCGPPPPPRRTEPASSAQGGSGGGGGARRSVTPAERVVRAAIVLGLGWWLAPHARAFYKTCDDMARYSLSHTQLTWKDGSGGQVGTPTRPTRRPACSPMRPPCHPMRPPCSPTRPTCLPPDGPRWTTTGRHTPGCGSTPRSTRACSLGGTMDTKSRAWRSARRSPTATHGTTSTSHWWVSASRLPRRRRMHSRATWQTTCSCGKAAPRTTSPSLRTWRAPPPAPSLHAWHGMGMAWAWHGMAWQAATACMVGVAIQPATPRTSGTHRYLRLQRPLRRGRLRRLRCARRL